MFSHDIFLDLLVVNVPILKNGSLALVTGTKRFFKQPMKNALVNE